MQDDRYKQCFLLDKSCRTIFSAVLRQQRKSDVMTSFGYSTRSAVYYEETFCGGNDNETVANPTESQPSRIFKSKIFAQIEWEKLVSAMERKKCDGKRHRSCCWCATLCSSTSIMTVDRVRTSRSAVFRRVASEVFRVCGEDLYWDETVVNIASGSVCVKTTRVRVNSNCAETAI
jgi:hypothetical protein